MTADLSALEFIAGPPGSGFSQVLSVKFDLSGDLFAAGSATSKDFPGINPVQNPAGGSCYIATTGSSTFASELFNTEVASIDVQAGVFQDNSTVLFATSPGGLAQAPASGSSFTRIGNLKNPSVNGLAVDPTNNMNLFVTYFDPNSLSSKFDQSTDGGMTWNPVVNMSDFPSNSFFNEPLVDSTGDPSVLAGGSLFRFNQTTTHWNRLGPSNMNHVFDRDQNSDLAAIDAVTGLWTSTDGGTTFKNVQNNTFDFTAVRLAANGSLLLGNGAAASNGMNPLLISPDAGVTLANGGLPTGVTIRAMATSPVLVNGKAEVSVLAAPQSGPGEIRLGFSADGGMTFVKDKILRFPSFSLTSSLPPFVKFSPDGSKVFAGGPTNADATIFDWDPEGNDIFSSTFGGSSDDFAYAIFGVSSQEALQALAILCGSSSSLDFPIWSGPQLRAAAAQSQLKGIANGVLVEIAEASPTATPTATATFTATATATTSPTATATPQAGTVSITPNPVNLGTAKMGKSKTKKVTIKNTSSKISKINVTVTGETASAPFSVKS